MKATMKNAAPTSKAIKRAPALGLVQWYNGMLTTNLEEKKDTAGTFFVMEGMLTPGTEPPPHVHTREDELFYVLEGEFDMYVGEEAFKVEAGEVVFLPRFKPHAFVIRSPRLRALSLFTPAGLEDAFRGMSKPAQSNFPLRRSPIGRVIWSIRRNDSASAVYASWLGMRLRSNCPCIRSFHRTVACDQESELTINQDLILGFRQAQSQADPQKPRPTQSAC